MSRFLVTCSYDGSNFAGWQKQKNHRNVQSEIEKALAVFDPGKPFIVGCSRTDAGVHAYGQRFHFDTDLEMTEYQVLKAINSHLPDDIRITAVAAVADDFHARYLAIAKHYEYLINNGEYNVLTRNYQTYIKEKLDIDSMRAVSRVFIGEHDFTTFCATTREEKDNQVRIVYEIKIEKNEGLIKLSFYGNGFLRHMVRMITQTLVEAGRGKLTREEAKSLLSARDKRACRYNAKAEGLYLVRIDYADD